MYTDAHLSIFICEGLAKCSLSMVYLFNDKYIPIQLCSDTLAKHVANILVGICLYILHIMFVYVCSLCFCCW